MIKLKDIIKEIVSQNALWDTPPDTPDEVIDVMHQIIAHIMDIRGIKTNPMRHVKLKKIQDLWQITRPDKPETYLIYVPTDDLWWSPVDDTKSRVKMIPLNHNDLESTIESWLA